MLLRSFATQILKCIIILTKEGREGDRVVAREIMPVKIQNNMQNPVLAKLSQFQKLQYFNQFLNWIKNLRDLKHQQKCRCFFDIL